MSKVKHTPGPWRVNTDGCGDIFVSGAGSEYICDLGACGNQEDQLRADAYLIAAAPELLTEARMDLQAWENALELGLIPERHRDTALARIGRLRTAIAKATK